MRVLLVNDYRDAGGCERVMQRTEVGLRARGHEVQVFTGADVDAKRTPLSYLDNRAARRALRARLDAFEPDVVHFFNVYHELSPGVLEEAHRWRGGRHARLVMTCPDANLVCPNSALQYFEGACTRPFEPGRLPGRIDLWRTRWDHRSRAHSVLKSAQHAWNYRVRKRWRCLDAVGCASGFLERALAPTGLPRVRLPDPLPATLPERRQRPEGGPLRLVFCGRLEPEKGLVEFVCAAAAVDGWVLDVVGGGAERRRVEHAVRRFRLEDRVTLHGKVGATEALERIAEAQLLVLPSRCGENAPASMFEALACGTGLLVSGIGGMAEIVADAGTGRTFDPFDPGDMQRALTAAVRDHQSGGEAHAQADAYLADRTVENYLNRLEKMYHGEVGGMPCAC